MDPALLTSPGLLSLGSDQPDKLMVQSLTVKTLPQLRLFMEHHVFAVWDFMQLLKSLQQLLAPSGTPWKPPRFPRIARLITDLVAEEECDCLPVALGGPTYLSHFSIYRLAMEEVGADTGPIESLLAAVTTHGLEAALTDPAIPEPARRFMATTQALINSENPHLLATSFCYGRELLLPALFHDLHDQLITHKLHAPILSWYLERHVSLDGDNHGPSAEEMVIELCDGSAAERRAVASVRAQVIQERQSFWDAIAEALESLTTVASP